MIRKNSLYLIFITVFANSMIFASKPTVCPEVTALQEVGLNHAQLDEHKIWIAAYLPSHKYETRYEWTFALSGEYANSQEDALRLGTQALNSLTFFAEDRKDEYTACMYISEKYGVLGEAVTPPTPLPSFK